MAQRHHGAGVADITGVLIYMLRGYPNALLVIAMILLGNSVIFTLSHAIENGLQRMSIRWGDKEFSGEGERD